MHRVYARNTLSCDHCLQTILKIVFALGLGETRTLFFSKLVLVCTRKESGDFVLYLLVQFNLEKQSQVRVLVYKLLT